jgi:hypothetical protein
MVHFSHAGFSHWRGAVSRLAGSSVGGVQPLQQTAPVFTITPTDLKLIQDGLAARDVRLERLAKNEVLGIAK